MPYSTNDELPKAVRDKLKGKKLSQWREVFNSVFADSEDEGRAAASAWSAVNKDEIGRFIRKDNKQNFTLGIVYEPNVADAHDEMSTIEEIEKASWNFMRKLQGKTTLNKAALSILTNIIKAFDEGEGITLDITDLYEEINKAGLNDMHVNTDGDDDLGDIVANFTAPADFEIKSPSGEIEKIKEGTWLMGIVWDPEYFTKNIITDKRTGLSMEGLGRRVEIDT